MSDQEFESADAGASLTYPAAAGSIRKGGFCLLKGKPCKVVETSVSKTGKHGHAKVHFVGIDIFTNKKYEDICPSSHNVEVPNVARKDYTLIEITDEGFLSMMDDNADMREDLQLPSGELGETIKSLYDDGKELVLSVQKAMDMEMVIAQKEAAPGK
eukprot:GFYU01001789.1.p1 GENE.GFYU01001789.1~~GFYU01001789.1.p1  ORF type:complete len:157 (-),score=61.52 GFYU01001789.1:294-764(-)